MLLIEGLVIAGANGVGVGIDCSVHHTAVGRVGSSLDNALVLVGPLTVGVGVDVNVGHFQAAGLCLLLYPGVLCGVLVAGRVPDRPGLLLESRHGRDILEGETLTGAAATHGNE